jgi:ParB/RepB/Spo0J family partition protein
MKAKISEIEIPSFLPVRSKIDPTFLEHMKDSITERGVVTPLSVRPKPEGGYELVDGYVRLTACRELGLEEVPIDPRDRTDEEVLIDSLVINEDRYTDIFTEAAKYEALKRYFDYPVEQLSMMRGVSMSYISECLKIASLSERVKNILLTSEKLLGRGHIYPLTQVDDEEKQLSLAEKLVKEDWTVRKVREQVARARAPKKSEADRLIEEFITDHAHADPQIDRLIIDALISDLKLSDVEAERQLNMYKTNYPNLWIRMTMIDQPQVKPKNFQEEAQQLDTTLPRPAAPRITVCPFCGSRPNAAWLQFMADSLYSVPNLTVKQLIERSKK